eukprot:309831-Chlamydomonas_euryale.AAC.2
MPDQLLCVQQDGVCADGWKDRWTGTWTDGQADPATDAAHGALPTPHEEASKGRRWQSVISNDWTAAAA